MKKLMQLLLVSALLVACATEQNVETTTTAIDNEVQQVGTAMAETADSVETTASNYSSTSNYDTTSTSSTGAALPYGARLEFPENPSEGECFAKIGVPAQFTYKSERVMVRPERRVVETTPAEYANRPRTITLKEASSSLKVVPATYTTATEQVLVTPEREVLKTIAPTYRTITEKVLITPERKVWKVGREWKDGSLATKYGNSGEIRCLVKEPAVYQTITRRVVDQPARVTKQMLPAVYKTITKTVVDQEARTVEVPLPAITKTVNVREMVSGPKSFEKVIPAVYKDVKRKVVTTEPYEMWSPILCRTNDSNSSVTALQTALKKKGYYNLDVDGVIGPSTHRAVHAYQSRELSKPYYAGRITFDTLKSLDLL